VALTPAHVTWAYRILLDRDPESDQAVANKIAGCPSVRDLRAEILSSAEYRTKNPEFAQGHEDVTAIKILHDGTRIFLNLADHAIGVPVLKGQYEQAELRFATGAVHSGEVAIDAGAHVGVFALTLAAAVGPAGHVYAFEPFAANADLLERSIAENQFQSRMTLHRAAVGEVAGVLPLYFARETLNLGGAFTLPEGRPVPPDLERVDVPVVRLDDVALRRPVRLLKMDVEGAEPLVVRGAQRLLREDRPIVLSEVHPVQLQKVSGVSPTGFGDQLAAFGYRPFAIRADGSLERLSELPGSGVTTIAFLPQGRE